MPSSTDKDRTKDRDHRDSGRSRKHHHHHQDDDVGSSSHHGSHHDSKRHRSSKEHDSRSTRSSRTSHHKNKSSPSSSSRKAAAVEHDDDEWQEAEAGVESSTGQHSISTTILVQPSLTVGGPPKDTYGTFNVGGDNIGSSSSLSSTRVDSVDNFTDGYGQGENGTTRDRSLLGDLFSDMGTERKRSQPKQKPDPTVSTHQHGSDE